MPEQGRHRCQGTSTGPRVGCCGSGWTGALLHWILCLTLQIYPTGGLDWSDMAQEAGSYPYHPTPKARKPLLLMDLPYVGREGSNSQRLFSKQCKWYAWPRLAIPKKMSAKTATLPPCSCSWHFSNSPGVQALRESRGNWQFTGPSLPETINHPDAHDNPSPDQ
jgi:hypothetical protein